MYCLEDEFKFYFELNTVMMQPSLVFVVVGWVDAGVHMCVWEFGNRLPKNKLSQNVKKKLKTFTSLTCSPLHL